MTRDFLQRRVFARAPSPLALYAVVYAAAAATQKGVGFILFLWLAAVLSVEDYAKFGLFFALQTGIAGLAGAGILESVVGRLKHHQEDGERRGVLDAGGGAFAILASLVALLVFAISGWLQQQTGATLADIAILALVGILSGFYLLQAQIVRLEERHLVSLTLNNAPMLVAFLGGFVGFLAVGTLAGFFTGMALGLSISFLVFFNLYTNLRRSFSDFGLVTEIVRHILPFIAIAVSAWLLGYGSTFMINSFFNAVEVSRFTFAFTLSAVMQLVATSLNQVWSPRFFRIVHGTVHTQVETQSRRFFMLQGAVLGGVGAGILLIAPLAIVLTGERLAAYSGLSAELFLLFAAYAVLIPWYHAQNYFYAHSRGGELMSLVMAASVGGLFLWLAAIWLLGPIGAYLGFALQMLVRSVIIMMGARREWPIWFHWQGSAIALVLLALGTFAGEALLRIWLP